MDPYEFTRQCYNAEYSYSINQFPEDQGAAVSNRSLTEHSNTHLFYQNNCVDLNCQSVRENPNLSIPLRNNLPGHFEGPSNSLHPLYDVPTVRRSPIPDFHISKQYGYERNEMEQKMPYFPPSSAQPPQTPYLLPNPNILTTCASAYPVAYTPMRATAHCLTSTRPELVHNSHYTQAVNFSPEGTDRSFIETLVRRITERSVTYVGRKHEEKQYYDFAHNFVENSPTNALRNIKFSGEMYPVHTHVFERGAQNYQCSVNSLNQSSKSFDRNYVNEERMSTTEFNNLHINKSVCLSSGAANDEDKCFAAEDVKECNMNRLEQKTLETTYEYDSCPASAYNHNNFDYTVAVKPPTSHVHSIEYDVHSYSTKPSIISVFYNNCEGVSDVKLSSNCDVPNDDCPGEINPSGDYALPNEEVSSDAIKLSSKCTYPNMGGLPDDDKGYSDNIKPYSNCAFPSDIDTKSSYNCPLPNDREFRTDDLKCDITCAPNNIPEEQDNDHGSAAEEGVVENEDDVGDEKDVEEQEEEEEEEEESEADDENCEQDESPEGAIKYFLESNCLNVTTYKALDGNSVIKEFHVKSDWFPEVILDVNDEEQRGLLTFVQQTHLRVLLKNELRKINYNLLNRRPDEKYFTKLDSSLKKNTAFVRKLKTFTGNQLQSLLKDMSTLNLSKYVSEIAAALVDAKLKMVDVWPAIQLCSLMHQTYVDFGSFLLDNWQKVLSLKKDEKIANQAKLRVDIRFYAELISVGIFTHKEGLPLLGNILTILTNSDREEHHNINIILSFCRHCGDDYAGLVPRRLRVLAQKYGISIPQYDLLSKEKQRNVRSLLRDYYNSLCKHRLKEHLDLQNYMRQNRKILQTKGELSSERKEKLEALQTSFERIDVGTHQFAEALDEDVPALPEDESLKHDTTTVNVTTDVEEDIIPTDLWEDEETKRFYEKFPDLEEFIPCLRVRAPVTDTMMSEEALEAEFEKDINSASPEEEAIPTEPEDTEEAEASNVSNKVMLESFLSALPKCINQEMIDSAAIDFAMNLNTKNNRRKVVRTLFNVPRIRLDLLPFYGRFVAALHPVQPDIAEELCNLLKQDFKYHIRKKDQLNIESKVKVVRFIGELVKFRMYKKFEGLYCLKVLVQDFTHHHIEMCSNLLESCGRFLIRHQDCYQRMKIYLEQMMRKKAVMALDSRYVTMIENAYYFVNPPDSALANRKERPPEHEFIRKILYQDLTKSNIDKILKLMRKLDWNQQDVASYAIKCLTYAYNIKYFNIRCLANLLAGLVPYQEFVGTHVVDGVLEDIRLGMEVNLPKYNQRRVAMIKYLGELYNYRMIESINIFQVLYTLISFGVIWDWNFPSDLDPPDNLFRIRLACILLETCGQYFVSGQSKKNLDMFLVYFQHYYWFKLAHPIWTTDQPFPVGVKHMVRETITNLRRNISLFESLEEAEDAVIKLHAEQEKNLGPLKKYLQSSSLTDDVSQGSTANNSTEFEDESELGASDEDTSQDELDTDDGATSATLDGTEVPLPDNEENLNGDRACDTMLNEKDAHCEMSYSFIAAKSDPTNQEVDSENKDVVPHKTDVNQAPKLVECPEDDDFLNAFERMVSDNIQDRFQETVNPQQVDISVPLHVRGNTKKTYEQLKEEETEKSNVNFVLMLRKGHKQQYKNLAVPVDSEMALNLKNREEAERAEKEKVKRLTLDISERLEEEDYQEMLAQAQRPAFMNLNRERRHKYHHPKGAPDADLIFGPKKAR